MKRALLFVAAGLVSVSICAPILARGLSAQTPNFFPFTNSAQDPTLATGPNAPLLYSDFGSLSITEQDTSFVYQLSFTPGTRTMASAAGAANPSYPTAWPTAPVPANSNCNSAYYSDNVYFGSPVCAGYMINWGPGPAYQSLTSGAAPVSAQIIVYQFDSASAIALINCANDGDSCDPPSAADAALTLPQPAPNASVVIANPVDVIEVDFNYSATSCKGRTASFTVNDLTYVYTGTDLCAEATNAFYFYVGTAKNGTQVAKLAAPKPAHWSIG